MVDLVSIPPPAFRIWLPVVVDPQPPLPLRLLLLRFQLPFPLPLQLPLLLRLPLKPLGRVRELCGPPLDRLLRRRELRPSGGEVSGGDYFPAFLSARRFSARFWSAGRTASHFWR